MSSLCIKNSCITRLDLYIVWQSCLHGEISVSVCSIYWQFQSCIYLFIFPPQTAIEKLSADYLTMFHFPPLIKVMEIVFTKYKTLYGLWEARIMVDVSTIIKIYWVASEGFTDPQHHTCYLMWPSGRKIQRPLV